MGGESHKTLNVQRSTLNVERMGVCTNIHSVD